jgi:IS5 family transposase
MAGKKRTSRPGIDLWQIFVLSQAHLCQNISYDELHDLANHHNLIRQIIGFEKDFGYEWYEFEYQSIIDIVSLLDNEAVRELNQVIVEFGHGVLKRKAEAIRCITDSFVEESNLRFPTDYNLLRNSARKCPNMVDKFLKRYPEVPR